MILAGFFLFLSIVAYAIKELQYHNKLRWMNYDQRFGFWGEASYLRKYKCTRNDDLLGYPLSKAPDTWYYRFFKIPYREKWPTSATFTVLFTDGVHLTQSISFICLALSISILSNVALWYVWPFVLLVNSLTYKIFSR